MHSRSGAVKRPQTMIAAFTAAAIMAIPLSAQSQSPTAEAAGW